MKWFLAFHIIFVIAWFAGLFYLPRLYVYHAMASDKVGQERFKVMEHKLFYYITTPAGILASVFGFIVIAYDWTGYLGMLWLQAKLFLVLLLWIFHIYCGKLLMDFKRDQNRYSHRFYRFFNEIPTLLLIGIVLLAIIKPF